MNDPQSGEPVPSDESGPQKQARLRRERRDAKIKAGGSARLDKITQLSGRPAEAASSPSPANEPAPTSVNDPDEGDISNHQYPTRTPPGRNDVPTEADIRQLLRSAPPTLDAQNGQQTEGQNDPMVQMLQQIMGGMSGAQEGGEIPGGLPPGLAALLGGGGGGGGAGFPGMPGQAQGQPRGEEDKNIYLWKLIHAIFAFMLGIYMTAVTTFNGAQFSRVETVLGGDADVGKRLFWIFATAEVVLQGSRFMLEKGKSNQGGWMGTLMQVLPEPWRGYVALVARYSGIWFTIVEDAMVVLFVLGCTAWSRGAEI